MFQKLGDVFILRLTSFIRLGGKVVPVFVRDSKGTVVKLASITLKTGAPP